MKSLQDSSFNISLYSLRYMSLSPRIIEEFRYNTYIYIYYLTLPYQVELARQSTTRSFHLSLSFIAAGNSSVLHPVSFTS